MTLYSTSLICELNARVPELHFNFSPRKLFLLIFQCRVPFPREEADRIMMTVVNRGEPK